MYDETDDTVDPRTLDLSEIETELDAIAERTQAEKTKKEQQAQQKKEAKQAAEKAAQEQAYREKWEAENKKQ